MQRDTILALIDNLKDEKSIEIKNKIKSIANFNVNLLIFGETGTGKDFWVEYLYQISNYETLLNLNCGDVPESLIESEWFGYKKGAFTGADKDYEGKWKKAENGILFLNQVDILSINMQSKLLRIIERKKYFPLGSNKETEINVRFVFSTSESILNDIKTGKFREDLFYRISTYSIFIPPLRERKKDILALTYYFADKYNVKINLDKNSLRLLTNFEWKGNIRELENFIRTLSIENKELNYNTILDKFNSSDNFIKSLMKSEINLEELEKEYILFLIEKYKNKAKVARILNISRKSLYNKLNKYGKT